MKVLIVHPRLGPCGGGQAVAAWTLQGLREHCELTLLTYHPVDVGALNAYFGTALEPGDFRLRLVPRRYRAALRLTPTTGALLEGCLLMRAAAAIASEFDISISTHNEVDFGAPGVQYVHYPAVYHERPPTELRWFHLELLVRRYRALCYRVACLSPARLRENVSLVNSAYIRSLAKQAFGADARIVYPPVARDFPERPWSKRRDAVVCIGRLNRHKRWGDAFQVVRTLRGRGHDLALTLIGTPDDDAFQPELRRMQEEGRGWFRVYADVSRRELTRLVSEHRYGMHTMHDEHFGIAVAELIHAGCIPFVHDSGGPPEIIGGDARLTFRSVDEAADKLERILRSEKEQADVRQALAARSDLFTPERFMQEMRDVVDAWPMSASDPQASTGTAIARNSALRSSSSP